MVAYSLGANRLASNIDGGGTELDTGDTVTTNAFTITLDGAWTKNACGTVTVSTGGRFINEAGVDVAWDANSTLHADNSIVEIRGTSGSPITYTGDLNYIGGKDGGWALIDYLTYTYDLYGLYCAVGGSVYCYNSAFTGTGTAGVLAYDGIYYLENCTMSSGQAQGVFRCAFHSTIWLVDTTITSTHVNNDVFYTIATGAYPTLYIVGSSNIEGNEITDSHLQSSTRAFLYYYSTMKTTVDDGIDPLQNAMVPYRHKVAKGHIFYSRNSIYPTSWYGGRYKEMNTDANGINRCYALSKIWDGNAGAYIYISDENQAEAGDNAPYLVNPEYPNYQSPTPETEAWAIETGNGNKDETDIGTLSCIIVGALNISNQVLNDYSLTTSQFALAECDVSIASTGVVVLIEGKAIPLEDRGSNHWSGIVYGNYVGVVTNVAVTFLATDGTSCDVDAAPSNLTVTASSVKVNPDPLDTIYQMILSGYDKSNTDNEKIELKALVDSKDPHEVMGMRGMDFKIDGAYIYELNESEQAKGTGYDHVNRIDPVSIDVHCNGTRAHFRKVIDMLKSLLNAQRKHPTTYPLNTDYPYDSMYFEGSGNEFSGKYTGHFRIIFTVRLMSFWESIT